MSFVVPGYSASLSISSYTWAGKPNPAGLSGVVIRISDIGTSVQGSYWISDGVFWYPLNGEVLLYEQTEAFSVLAPAAPNAFASIPVYSGLLTPGAIVEVSFNFTKSLGTDSTILDYFFGPLGSASDPMFTGTVGFAANVAGAGRRGFFVIDEVTMQSLGGVASAVASMSGLSSAPSLPITVENLISGQDCYLTIAARGTAVFDNILSFDSITLKLRK